MVLNSCCHGGVVNIVKGVLDQFPGQRVYALLGGLHMLSPGANALNCPPDYVRQVAAALLELGVEHLWTGHCTGPAAFALLKEELGDGWSPSPAECGWVFKERDIVHVWTDSLAISEALCKKQIAEGFFRLFKINS